ncbi:MAG: metallophosphoesterase family protein [Candidatus Hermodarchaeota archaeon]
MLDLTLGNYPIIIAPNIGNPILLNFTHQDRSQFPVKSLSFRALVVASKVHSAQNILEQFHQNLFIQPILKDNGEFSRRRGDLINLHLIEIEKIEKLDFRDQLVLEEENCIVWDINNCVFQFNDVFGKREHLYRIKLEIRDLLKIEKLLTNSNRDFLLFDIVHDIPNFSENKVNYHSIAIFNKDWEDFNFIHASDFHVARRNDFILHYLRENIRSKLNRFGTKKRKLSKIDNFVLTRDFEYKEDFQKERIEELRWAKYNFNYNLRKLIEFANRKAEEKKLDFMFMTGDLIDYLNIARGNYQYENNFRVFLDILLGLNKGLENPPNLGSDQEFINKLEINVPIFTIPGNHDYRKNHYGMRFGQIHKIFGMTHSDVKGYYDHKFFNYFTALRADDKYLKDYFRYINPNLNFNLRIGEKYHFIFLDTGQDSVADLHDLLKGGPSTKGIKEYQVDLLRAYIKLAHNEKIIVVMHTPPISPNLNTNKKRKYKKKLNIKNRPLKWSDFYEKNLRRYDGTGRLDKILNLKYQTIMYNWATLLRIFTGSDKVIRRKVDIIMCGHTHTLKEYRLKEAKETERINFGFWFFPIYIEVPCEVYTSRYRDKFKEFKDPSDLQIWFDVNKPFILQTQAVGPLSASYKFKPPGFRLYEVKENQIVSANVFSLHLK